MILLHIGMHQSLKRSSWKGALLVCGEPGTGKSQWIKQEATVHSARTFRWNCRADRSLREGREILHQQVRSCEPLFVWLEGADDLTQEAQAFLRRILETASSNVVCALEVRELWKMSSPILSRCTVVYMKSGNSYRMRNNYQKARHCGLITKHESQYTGIRFKDLPALRKAGEDPCSILNYFITTSDDIPKNLIEAFRAIGIGSSPWIQLAKYLMRKEIGL
jgi:replication-associated recombination protein RarA